MGYGPGILRYYQTYAGTGTCMLTLTQAMGINADGNSPPMNYHNHPVTISVAPTSISVTRDTSSSGIVTYPTQ